MKFVHRSALTSTGLLLDASKYRVTKGEKLAHPLRSQSIPVLAVLAPDGEVKAAYIPSPKAKRVIHKSNRFVTKSAKRNIPKNILGKADRGYGMTAKIAYIRKVIKINTGLEFQGNGVWA